MNTILYFSASGAVYETRAYTEADINTLIQDQGLYCLTSADRQFDFWFSPATQGCQRQVNRAATEVLLATTDFTAKSVPLLRGCVVVATHDSDGDLDGLSWQQLDELSAKAATLSRRDDRVLDRRIAGDERRRAREIAPAAPAPAAVSCARPQAGAKRRGSSHAPSLNR
ncbi:MULTISPECIES: hypothetical protein [Mycolicibacterium]|uniref:Uncharacterized protein n=2 Tax=Mycolicibacterium gilvum TaxID=1804 RepID=E6TNM5_MYCSR|nr:MULTISPECIES: hypothetical protein [Mycolicibacterium]ADU01702.1 hypothetical protein Mspyr1_51750 [Mycolicibacterium gilvum Spyr1]MBV5242247.1 hypothetical protein [Mycolicibacterium sp. PAM1]MCV7054019.1 hypothetical protein [Mycolicibacterium gilvum]STZ46281.1 Uncharacterised protein [Mycolicibacterium gilvum]